MQKELNYEELLKTLLKHKNILLISGRSLKKTVFFKKLGDISSVNFFQFSNFTENPKLPDVLNGLDVYRKSQATLILAVGGGTAIDIAKLIKFYSDADLKFEKDFPLKNNICSSHCILIAVPTTFGTGSEATHFAVLYVNGEKHSISAKSILPNFYLLDSALGDSLPLEIKASTCLDALCQGIESFWSLESNEESRDYACIAIKKIIKNIEVYLNSSLNRASHNLEIAYASNLAGKAVNISKTTASHALSYTLTSKFGVPHGHAVALCIRKMFSVMENFSSRVEIKEILKNTYKMLEVKDANEAEDLFNRLMILGGLETDLRKLGIVSSSNIELIVDNVNVERLTNHPVKLKRSDLLSLLKTKNEKFYE